MKTAVVMETKAVRTARYTLKASTKKNRRCERPAIDAEREKTPERRGRVILIGRQLPVPDKRENCRTPETHSEKYQNNHIKP